MKSTPPRRILLTAFEPSGDALAAPLVEGLLAMEPGLDIYALGGPKMQLAGAKLLETTTEQAAMLLGAVSQAGVHHQRLRRLKRWLTGHALSALVAVDSPAANWSICKRVRQTQPAAKILHLAAPQLWAWAPWRIGKLRRLTDQVLCLLPFEPAWFTQRRVPAVFVGHPLFDAQPEPKKTDNAGWGLPSNGEPKIALLPGSRPGEIQRNWPTMAGAFTLLRQKHPNLCGLVAASNASTAQQVRHITEATAPGRSWPDGLAVATAQTQAVLDWADTALVVSGTATLLSAARRRPMVVIYNVGRCSWQLWGRWVVRTRTFALPNLITQADGLDPAVPEWVPHFGQTEPIADAVDQLTSDPEARNRQLWAFDHITQRFAGRSFVHTCTQQVLDAIR